MKLASDSVSSVTKSSFKQLQILRSFSPRSNNSTEREKEIVAKGKYFFGINFHKEIHQMKEKICQFNINETSNQPAFYGDKNDDCALR